MRVFLPLLLVFIFINSFSQEISTYGSPHIDNFSVDDYHSLSKNWMITQSDKGLIYVANGNKLLEYDGLKWNKYSATGRNHLSVKSHGDRIYIGYEDDFGYWKYNEHNEFVYTSLYPAQTTKDHKYEEFWNILVNDGLIYFQSLDNIYIYKNDVLTRIAAPYKFNTSYKVNGKIYVEDIKYGLFELKTNKLENVVSGKYFSNASICGLTGLEDNSLLVVTKQFGLFKVKNGKFEEYKFNSGEFLKDHMVFSFKSFNGKYLGFGTVLNGLLITDLEGNAIQHINKSSGLQNNTVLNIYCDLNNNLWLALNNGVSLVHLNSPITHYNDYLGKVGTIYATLKYNNKLYLGTNQGLFYMELDDFENKLKQSEFKLVSGSEGQVWSLNVFRNKLICGHNKGTFIINDTVAENISLVRGGWNYTPVKNSNILIGGNYRGVELFKFDENNNLKSYGLINGFEESTRFIEFDKYNDLWVGHTAKGLYKLKFNKSFSRVNNVKYFDLKDFSSDSSSSVYLFKKDNEVWFSDGYKIYEYDIVNNKIVPTNRNIDENSVYYQKNRVYYLRDFEVISDNKRLEIYNSKHVNRDSILGFIYNRTTESMGNDFENVFQIGDNYIFAGKVDGFSIFNSNIKQNNEFKLDEGPLLREMYFVDENAKANHIIIDDLDDIKYEKRFVNFQFAYPDFSSDLTFHYYLKHDGDTIRQETNDRGWFIFLQNSYGDFELDVVAKSGNKISKTKTVKFTVNKPIAISAPFILLYFVLAAAILSLFYYLHKRKVNKNKEFLIKSKKLALEQQKNDFERSELEKVARINQLERERLESEVVQKSYQLASIAKQTAHRNEILEKVMTKIESINNRSSVKMPKKYINEINEYLQSYIDDSNTKTVFENNFKAVNSEFYKKLVDKFPDLSPSELKLAAFLKMNLSTKEISELLNVTPKSLEVSRYRLRKKLNLDRSDNLVSFLLNI